DVDAVLVAYAPVEPGSPGIGGAIAAVPAEGDKPGVAVFTAGAERARAGATKAGARGLPGGTRRRPRARLPDGGAGGARAGPGGRIRGMAARAGRAHAAHS